ncbi:haloacid dehalogenase superfamily enzyme, subfamily IA [Chamaesiphon minutus PCC 6605]|uniref:Haloacid dehalogenase superfamily enzyme, subfamily IA n=2 Tax=Chamaesiphon TaxID=217161 RepID=K9UDU1_CHAP6|nr:haloacid dehalogenase superfamily enzyme, subfamily IA [Chamaesiphon minutus PCC 6605]
MLQITSFKQTQPLNTDLKPRLIIFDFDGTLADSLVIMIDITNRLASEFGYKQLSDDFIATLKYLSPWEIVRAIDVALWKIPWIVQRVRQEFYTEAKRVELFSGIVELVERLKAEHYRLGIVSSNSEANIHAVLRQYGIEHRFDFVTSASTFGKGRAISKVIKQSNIERANAVYVGDEIRDIRAARSVGIKIVAVSWGFNDPTALLQQKPDLLIAEPADLLSAIDRLYSPAILSFPAS